MYTCTILKTYNALQRTKYNNYTRMNCMLNAFIFTCFFHSSIFFAQFVVSISPVPSRSLHAHSRFTFRFVFAMPFSFDSLFNKSKTRTHRTHTHTSTMSKCLFVWLSANEIRYCHVNSPGVHYSAYFPSPTIEQVRKCTTNHVRTRTRTAAENIEVKDETA